MIKINEVITPREKRRFFKFPIELYKESPYYVPCLLADEMDTFNPRKNGAYSYAESRLWTAERNGKTVGRIGAILNHAANEKGGCRQLRFTRFDFIDDFEVSQALFDTVKAWAVELGMTEIIGPLGFSNLDKQGMLIEGFEEMDMYITLYNYPYYVDHLERLGCRKNWDWMELKINMPSEVPAKVKRVAEIARTRFGYSIKKFSSMSEVKPYIKRAMEVINVAFAKLHGVVPLSEKQQESLAKLVMLVGRPEYSIMVTDSEGRLIGFAFLAPSVSRALQRSSGRIGLRTLINLYKDLHNHEMIDFYMIGVVPEHQGHGVEAMILEEGIINLIRNGCKQTQTGPMLEDNHTIRNSFNIFDHRYHRRRRCYIHTI